MNAMEQEHFESFYPDATRSEEIDKILRFIKEGSSCQVLSLPGAGRTILFGLLTYNKHVRTKHLGESQKTIHFVVVNFSEVRKRPLTDVMKFLFLNLTESLRERGMVEENKVVGQKFREHLKFNDELVLFQGFKEAIDYLALEKKLTVVFLFDRFEEYVPSVSSEFFTNLRVLRNRAKYQFCVAFSLNRPLETLLDPTLLADFYEFVAGNFVYLKLYDKETTDFRVSQIEKITGKKVPKNLLPEIITLTGGHGKLVKLSVESLLARGKNEKNIGEFLLSQKLIKAALSEIWLSLSPSEQSDLREGKFEDQDILEYLTSVGLLKDRKIQIPLFTEFIKTDLTSPVSQKQSIVYDPNTNSIKRGIVTLSDQLTASEFRLLSYFLQHQERIVEREEIINVVWQEVKSTAGITDQAVDQLVFRLRRKIEEDPNNPVHLQTVKGRGFKFIP